MDTTNKVLNRGSRLRSLHRESEAPPSTSRQEDQGTLTATLKGQANIECSIKYQVLSDLTAMVGVVKQKKKASGEMEQSKIKMFTKKELQEQENQRLAE